MISVFSFPKELYILLLIKMGFTLLAEQMLLTLVILHFKLK